MKNNAISSIMHSKGVSGNRINSLNFVKIIVKGKSFYGLKADGTLWVHGDNKYGQLGIGSKEEIIDISTKVNIENIKDIISTGNSAFIIKNDGTLYGTGLNSSGQLGFVDCMDRTTFSIIPGINDVKQISCGGVHTFVLKNDGTVWACGSNALNQLGSNNGTDQHYFIKIDINNVKKVMCGYNYTFILKNDNTVMACGSNINGQLGMGTLSNTSVFTQVNNMINVKDIMISPYGLNTFILKNNNEVYGCGLNDFGQLGLSHSNKITMFNFITNDANKVMPGRYTTFILKNNGYLYYCGCNNDGELGNGGNNKMYTTLNSSIYTTPNIKQVEAGEGCTILLHNNGELLGTGSTDKCVFGSINESYINMNRFHNLNHINVNGVFINKNNGKLNILNSGNYLCEFDDNYIKQIECGCADTFVVKTDHTLWCCGYNNQGQLGLGDLSNRSVFTKVNIDNVKSVTCGYDHTFIIKNDGTVWATGYNAYGQLGLGNSSSVRVFTKVDVDNAKKVICGYDHTFIIKNDNSVWACGNNNYGQLGLNDTSTRYTFTRLTVDVEDVKDISCSYYFTFMLKNDGTVWSTGYNSYGQLGLGDSNRRIVFTKVNIENVKKITTGHFHTFILKNDNTAWACGNNGSGELGIGSTSSKYTFYQTGQDNVIDVSCGNSFSVIVKADGTSWSTGNNQYGQLGLGDTSNRSVFNKIDITNVSIVMCGRFHTLLIKKQNTMWLCGRNEHGQLNLGHTTNQNKFIGYKYASLSITECKMLMNNVIQKVVANNKNIYILHTDGTVYSYGDNSFGQLGIGNTNPYDKFSKLNLPQIKDVICNGNGSVYFLASDGYLYVCGNNSYGQLGLSDYNVKTLPVKITNVIDIKKISCGYSHLCILKNDGTIYTCGYNNYGQTGLSSTNTQIYYLSRVSSISDVVDIECSYENTYILKTDGKVWACGGNNYGQLNSSNLSDKKISFTEIYSDASSIYTGSTSKTIFVKKKITNEIYGCGYNKDDQLGLGHHDNVSGFTKINIDNVKYISCGISYTFILKNDGTVSSIAKEEKYCENVKNIMAFNNTLFIIKNDNTAVVYGTMDTLSDSRLKAYEPYEIQSVYGGIIDKYKQISINDIKFKKRTGMLDNSNNFYIFEGLDLRYNSDKVENVKTFDISDNHYCYVDINNIAYVKGNNQYGQLGLGTFSDYVYEYSKIEGITDVKEIACGENHTVILQNNGSIWVSGRNTEGQLGLGVKYNTNINTFTKVETVSNIKKVKCMGNTTYLLRNDDTLLSSGSNDYGELGNGTFVQSFVFSEVAINVKDFYCENNSVVMIKNANDLYIFGSNNENKFGVSSDILDKYNMPVKLEKIPGNTRSLCIGEKDVTLVQYGDNTTPLVQYVDKSFPNLKLKVLDNNPALARFFINNNKIAEVSSGFDNIITVTLNDNMFIFGENKFKVLVIDEDGYTYEDNFKINKQNIQINKDDILIIDNNKYSVLSNTQNVSSSIVSINKPIEKALESGETVNLCRDKISVEFAFSDGVKLNGNLVSVEKTNKNTVKEIYEVSKNFRKVQPIINISGNKNSGVRRPSFLANYLED